MSCTFFIKANENPPNIEEIKDKLQKGTMEEKVKAMKNLVKCLVSDETYPPIIMHIISNIIPCQHKSNELRKVMLLYWEVIDKCKSPTDKTLKEEIFLACNSLRNDLLCHNEYVRGRTLRLISRIMHRGVIEPLASAISSNLEHKSSYVRRNTVVCLYNVFVAFGSDVIGDIDDEIEELLQGETDLSTKRNAFLLLQKSNPEKALKYIEQQIAFQAVDEIGDILQLAILKILKQKCKEDPSQKPKLLKIVHDFSAKATESVMLECALTSTAISNSAQTIKASLYAYVTILAKTNELNVKKVILDRLEIICKNSNYLEEDLIEDLLKGLDTPSLDIKSKIIQIIISGITSKTSPQVLKRMEDQVEFAKEDPDYLTKIVKLLEIVVFRFSEHQKEVLSFCFSFLFVIESLPTQAVSALNNLLKKILEDSSNRKNNIEENTLKLNILNHFGEVRSKELIKVLLNLFGSHYNKSEQIVAVINQLKVVIGPLPISLISDSEEETLKDTQKLQSHTEEEKKVFRTVVLEDGSYSTELVPHKAVAKVEASNQNEQNFVFRNLVASDSIIGGVLARNISKMLYKIRKESAIFNKQACSILMILCSIIRYYEENIASVDQAVIQELSLIVRKIVENPQAFIEGEQNSKNSIFDSVAQSSHEPNLFGSTEGNGLSRSVIEKNPEDMINFRLLKKGGTNEEQCEFEFDEEEINEIFESEKTTDKSNFVSKLKSLVQLTGPFDPLYSEAFITVNKYDIAFQISLTNTTKSTLSNIQIEFSSPSKTLILEKALSVNLRPKESTQLRTQLRFTGGEFGVIYGFINYDNQAGLEQPYLITEDINIDYMQFIQPARISEEEFKEQWQKCSKETVIERNIPIDKKMTFKTIISILEQRLHAKLVENFSQEEDEEDSDKEYFMNCHLYGVSKLGENFMVNVTLFSGDSISLTITVKSKDDAVEQIIKKEISNCTFEEEEEEDQDEEEQNEQMEEP